MTYTPKPGQVRGDRYRTIPSAQLWRRFLPWGWRKMEEVSPRKPAQGNPEEVS